MAAQQTPAPQGFTPEQMASVRAFAAGGAVQHFDGGGAVWARQDQAVRDASDKLASDAAAVKATQAAEARQQFLALIKPEMLGSDGRFLGPQSGVNYMLEGLTPDGAFTNATTTDTSQDGRMQRMDLEQKKLMLNPAWREGPTQTLTPLRGLGLVLSGGALTGAFSGAAATAGGTGIGGSAGIGSGTVLGGAAATGTGGALTAAGTVANAAPGLAGWMGMGKGMAATAVNTGALNTGMSLARGKNIGDSLKDGVVSGALSPIGTFAGNAVGGGMVGRLAGNAAVGGAQGLVSGRGALSGARDGLVNGLVSEAGSYVGNRVRGATDSKFAGQAANTVTQASLRGGVNKNTLNALVDAYASGQLTDLSGLPPDVASAVVAVASRRTSPVGALTSVARSRGNTAVRRTVTGSR